jgi:hypothetical protein
MFIDAYFIGAYWSLFYWWLLVAINDYSIGGYPWLLVIILG